MSAMPILFFGHGNPLNALEDNAYTRAWAEIGKSIPRPRAVLVVSAHWYTQGTHVTAMPLPQTIHDFGGFPEELYQVQYPAPGDPALAAQVRDLLKPVEVELDLNWGLDHGAWSVLRHVFPQADVPVIQLSIDRTKPPAFHYELAGKLASLRDDGVLMIGSGNVAHNLRIYFSSRQALEPWALRFEKRVCDLLSAGEYDALIHYKILGDDAMLSVPTPEHYLPLLYVLALKRQDDRIAFPVKGVIGGAVSMLSVQMG